MGRAGLDGVLGRAQRRGRLALLAWAVFSPDHSRRDGKAGGRFPGSPPTHLSLHLISMELINHDSIEMLLPIQHHLRNVTNPRKHCKL